MLEDALRYPVGSDDRVSTLLIGGVLLAVPMFASLLTVVFGPLGLVAVLVTLPLSLVVEGYLLRVLRSAASHEVAAPSFTDWGGLFVDGAKLFAVNLAYGLVVAVPAVVVGVVAGVGLGAVSTGGDGTPNLAAIGTVTLLLAGVVVVLSFAVAYVLPAAMTNFAVRGRLGAAFDLSTIRQVIFTSDYLVGVLLGFVLGAVLGGVASLLSAVLVGIPLLFYAQVVSYYCFGRGFAEARASMAPGTERV